MQVVSPSRRIQAVLEKRHAVEDAALVVRFAARAAGLEVVLKEEPRRQQPSQDSSERVISDAQRERLYAIVSGKAKKLEIPQAVAVAKMKVALSALGFASTKELTVVPYDTLVKMAEQWTAESFAPPEPEQQEM